MTDHTRKFQVGQIVDLISSISRFAANGHYEIIGLRPTDGDTPQYKIKSSRNRTSAWFPRTISYLRPNRTSIAHERPPPGSENDAIRTRAMKMFSMPRIDDYLVKLSDRLSNVTRVAAADLHALARYREPSRGTQPRRF